MSNLTSGWVAVHFSFYLHLFLGILILVVACYSTGWKYKFSFYYMSWLHLGLTFLDLFINLMSPILLYNCLFRRHVVLSFAPNICEIQFRFNIKLSYFISFLKSNMHGCWRQISNPFPVPYNCHNIKKCACFIEIHRYCICINLIYFFC